jgi:hypothetical protein
MSATNRVRTLQGELGKTLGRIAEREEYHTEFRRDLEAFLGFLDELARQRPE